MRLQAEAVKLLAETSNLRYAYAVNNFFAEVNLVLDPAKPGKFQKPFDSSVTGMTESFNKLMQRYSELEAVLQTASVYFGPAVRTAIDKFIQNYASARVPSGPDLASIRETLIKQSGRGRVTEAGLDGTTNTLLIKPIANDSYSHLGTEINRAMTEEIQKEFESVVH